MKTNMAALMHFFVVLLTCLSVNLHRAGSVEVSSEDFANLLTRLEALETENRQLKRSVESLGQSRGRRFILDSVERPVAFTAGINPMYVDHFDPHQTIVFETTITDVGGAYNNATGMFVAPVPGLYVFSCSLMDEHTKVTMLHAEIVKDHTTVLGRVFAHASPGHYRDQGAVTVVTRLRAGDQVWVRIWDSNDVSVSGQLYSVFTGFLLYNDGSIVAK